MVPQSWIINCLKMYKISGKVIKFLKNSIENRKVELTAGGKSLIVEKIKRGVFQGDALSQSLFIIVMMPLNHILMKCTGGYKFHKSQKNINLLMYMDAIKLLAKNEKELETLIQAVRKYN